MSLLEDTLRDVANESALEKPERISLRLIAKEVDKVYAENKRLRKLLKEIKDEPLAAMKIGH